MKELPPLAPRATLWATKLGETEDGLRVVVIEAMPNGPPEGMDGWLPLVAVAVTPTAMS